jgi:hypothetical protein
MLFSLWFTSSSKPLATISSILILPVMRGSAFSAPFASGLETRAKSSMVYVKVPMTVLSVPLRLKKLKELGPSKIPTISSVRLKVE